MKSNKTTRGLTSSTWNLGLLYKSVKDPKIEEDVVSIEKLIGDFASRFDVSDKSYLKDKEALLIILTEYDKLQEKITDFRPMSYLVSLKDIDSKNTEAISKISLITDRLTKAENKLLFFEISIGTISTELKKDILSDGKFEHYRVLLSRIFDDAKYRLSVPEERILELKSLPAYDMWLLMNQRILSDLKIKWKGKYIPYSQASNLVVSLPKSKDRENLDKEISKEIKRVSPVAEAEMNAIVTNKKINDSLRGYNNAYDATIRGYRNEPETVLALANEVTKSFPIAHRFYKIKARLIKQKRLHYYDRSAEIGRIKRKFDFRESTKILLEIFGSLNPIYKKTLDEYVKNGQIDSHPRMGKTGGAYCRGAYSEPSYILLNHADDFRSFKTYAHEMGHAFHTLLSRSQGPLYVDYSTALAETASTLFESIALDSIFDTLSDREKMIALHDEINNNIATVFRQIACFNFEKNIHESVRTKGFLSKEELANMHNKHMKAYLGPVFDLTEDDGLFFVGWPHIRRFFYVYSYAFGLLVSKALLRKYKQDKSFWSSIERFLSAGGKDSPENILLKIGIDVRKPDFWREGLAEIEADIDMLEKLTNSR